jgi:hypothetical protein
MKIGCKRRACLVIWMSDNVKLSDQAQAEPGPALKQENPPEMTADTPHAPEIQAPALRAPVTAR